jgi:hypothetical protein
MSQSSGCSNKAQSRMEKPVVGELKNAVNNNGSPPFGYIGVIDTEYASI